MPNPIDDIEEAIAKLSIAAMTLTAAASVIGHEWHELIGGDARTVGLVSAAASAFIVLLAARFRR